MSILSVDFGNIYTRLVLLDQVDGVYQLIARAQTRTTDGFPINDLIVGFDRALRELGDKTNRVFLDDLGKILTPETEDRRGVDIFTATASLGRPLRTIIIALIPDISVVKAEEALSGTATLLVETIHLQDQRTEQERINTIIQNFPDLILITGGTDGGAEHSLLNLVETVNLAISLIDAHKRPLIIYAGNNVIVDQVKQKLDDKTHVLIADNIQPSFDTTNYLSLQGQLSHAFDIFQEERSVAFTNIATQSSSGILPTTQSYHTIIDYLGKTQKSNAIVVDIGSNISLVSAHNSGKTHTSIQPELGLGYQAPKIIEQLGLDEIRDNLPFNISARELYNYAANKSVRPVTVPATYRELHIEYALLRSCGESLLQQLPDELRDFATIIGAGSALSNTGTPSLAALLLLDIVQPTGISRLLGDPFGLVPALGAVANELPEAVVQVLEGNNLEPIGTSVCLDGNTLIDKPIMDIRIMLDNGSIIEHTLEGGHIWIYPLPVNRKAHVDIRVTARGVSIQGQRQQHFDVKGGTAGLIFDGRERPLNLGHTVEERAQNMPMWISEITQRPTREIDPAWLEEQSDANLFDLLGTSLEDDDSPTPKRRRGLFGGRRRSKPATESPPPESNTDDLEDAEDEESDETDDLLKELRDASLS